MNKKHKEAFRKLKDWCAEYQATISRHPEYDEVWFDFVELVNDQPVIIEYCAYEEFSAKDCSIIKLEEVLSKDKTFNFMGEEDGSET